MMHWDWGAGAPWMWGGWVMMISFWVLIILGIVVLARWIARESKGDSSGRETPLEILKKRYARGEIDRAQYEEMKKDIA